MKMDDREYQDLMRDNERQNNGEDMFDYDDECYCEEVPHYTKNKQSENLDNEK